MPRPADISRPIIEALYGEALVLADEVRTGFDLSRVGPQYGLHLQGRAAPAPNGQAVALTEEGLTTTTRMMHVLAWLLNHRAFLAGDMSEFQLRRRGPLPADRPHDSARLALLGEGTVALIEETRAIHARCARLDAAWRAQFAMRPSGLDRVRDRLRI